MAKNRKSENENKDVFKEGEEEFTFPNEDKYVGHYGAHISGLAWRQGTGVYTTHDGHIYESEWKDDKLNEAENVKITFSNKVEYCGRIHKYKYQGPGTYSFRKFSHLTCDFVNNKPVGDVIYIDHYGHLWYGKAGPETVLLAREHIFSYELDSERGKGKPKRGIKGEEEVEIVQSKQSSEQKSLDMKELERVTFAKSFQTPSGIVFGQSEWIKDFEEHDEARKKVLEKLATRGFASLTEEEKNWAKQESQNRKILQKRKEKQNLKTVHPELLRHHFEEQMKNTCPPITVLYANPYEILDGEVENESLEGYKMLTI